MGDLDTRVGFLRYLMSCDASGDYDALKADVSPDVSKTPTQTNSRRRNRGKRDRSSNRAYGKLGEISPKRPTIHRRRRRPIFKFSGWLQMDQNGGVLSIDKNGVRYRGFLSALRAREEGRPGRWRVCRGFATILLISRTAHRQLMGPSIQTLIASKDAPILAHF